MAIDPLETNQVGLARWIDKEANELEPTHWARELVHNSFDAGATRLIIDGWYDTTSRRTLLRLSDNGEGMTEASLLRHGRTLMESGGGRTDNFGVGGRLATLPFNPAGVVWASAAVDDNDDIEETMIQIVREHDTYGLLVEDIDGAKVSAFAPEVGMLDKIDETGTAVILYGKGVADTYTGDALNDVRTFLSRRFFRFPAEVRIRELDGASRVVVPYGDALDVVALEYGTVVIDDEGSVAHWYVLEEPDRRQVFNGQRAVSMIALRNGEELFDRIEGSERQRRYSAFGLTTKSARVRVAIIIDPGFEVNMSTNRAHLVRPENKIIPWEVWGDTFYDRMPDEIKKLVEVSATSVAINEQIARRMNPDWRSRIARTVTLIPAADGTELSAGGVLTRVAPAHGAGSSGGRPGRGGDTEPGGQRTPNPEGESEESRAVKGGRQPARRSSERRDPEVVWQEADEWGGETHTWALYYRHGNRVFLRKNAAIFQTSIAYWIEEMHPVPRSVVEEAVQVSYGAEAIMKVVHILSQDVHGWSPRAIDEALGEESLSASLLGYSSIDSSIKQHIQNRKR